MNLYELPWQTAHGKVEYCDLSTPKGKWSIYKDGTHYYFFKGHNLHIYPKHKMYFNTLEAQCVVYELLKTGEYDESY